ncbi:uncharacterized protein MYCFIDRAFT_204410 [Pseudocercospora fijiensis CIRAD86]|uniref:Uncharacterized protein n=1 Tax=Pseudocercospora fijiensis (strain CIRAD86) TaxID=383855 RepID=M3AS71_PSEFD|nr:uncharacterized protein MYCFIDRAFT_204410 [Pseudocercospora fijiensis CIRAD86]EME79993.1 hypothetical protein MYCFIDRAFT_204410 [Pseudocercospora fijiensis CIRAD86]
MNPAHGRCAPPFEKRQIDWRSQTHFALVLHSSSQRILTYRRHAASASASASISCARHRHRRLTLPCPALPCPTLPYPTLPYPIARCPTASSIRRASCCHSKLL